KLGWTVFSDQGYFMENVINAHDVSIRWRVWDGEDLSNPVQVDENGNCPFTTEISPYEQMQAPRVHKIQIFGSEITAEQAQFAKDNPVGDVGELSDIGGGGSDDNEEVAPDANAPVTISTVAQDGTGDYTKIQDAINAVPDGARGIIYIRPGIYEENLYSGTKTDKNKFISLIGENKETTILTSNVSRGKGNESNSYNDCAALNVYTSRFYAENLTIRNTSGNVGQAEALFTNGDAHIFNNCLLSGYQDTYKANTGSRGYFTNCTIEGATDFIYDGGMEWFDSCNIHLVKGGGYITAPAESGMPMTKVMYPELSQSTFYPGLFFSNCTVTAAEGVADGAYTLGRPWKEKCGSMFIHCTLPKAINATGWTAWNGTENTSSLYEYKSKDANGKLIDTSKRASFSHQATDAEVEAYMNPTFLFGKYSKTPFDYEKILRGATAPMNFIITPNEISWESDDNAAGYIIYKDGAFYKFTTEKAIAKDASDNAKYSVASVSKQGVVSKTVAATDAIRLPAFPTAEGFGKYTSGGRGGKVVKVNSLEDSESAGTLRWAFKQYPGEPITIVFEVSGDIKLKDQLRVNRADWTLAGQTAPGEGIVISHNKINFGGSQNFIVRNIRFRSGHADINGNVLQDQALGAENCNNYIFDHCVFGWSVEENINTQDCHFLTVQNSIVHEGLYNSGHKKGARGYGSQWGGSPATYYRNLLADNMSRSPRINGARGEDYVVFMEYINNVNYNFGKSNACYGGENTADISSYNGMNSGHECNFIGNYYKPGPATKSNPLFFQSSYARSGATSWGPAKWYVNGNVMEGNESKTKDNWKAVSAEKYSLSDIRVDERIVPEHNYYKYSVAGNVGTYDPEMYMIYNIESADNAYQTVLNNAGTINRDAIEKRIVNEARTGTAQYGGAAIGANKGIIDTENDCEGFIQYSTDYTVPADTDGDGIPDEWEKKHGLNPNVADQNLINGLGYTALEVYLNSLMGENLSDDFHTNSISNVKSVSAISYDRQSNNLFVSDNAIGAVLKVYSTEGKLLSTRSIASVKTSLSDVKQNVFIIRLEGSNINPRVLKLCK
ncbi:pectinesterase family protein, partial [Prevotella sp.]|uniref:pectinesterase family protein n=1 Tax=Prevotella sp. TaxID=59823 RepID=UPI003FD79E46